MAHARVEWALPSLCDWSSVTKRGTRASLPLLEGYIDSATEVDTLSAVDANRRFRSLTAVSTKAMLRQLLRMRVAPQVSDDRSLSAVYDFANVANDVFSIFVLNQVFVLNQISDRFLNCSP